MRFPDQNFCRVFIISVFKTFEKEDTDGRLVIGSGKTFHN